MSTRDFLNSVLRRLNTGQQPEAMRDMREEMIRETSLFLSWALAENRDLPRIPRRRMRDGGFSDAMRLPGAQKLTRRFWERMVTASWWDRIR